MLGTITSFRQAEVRRGDVMGDAIGVDVGNLGETVEPENGATTSAILREA